MIRRPPRSTRTDTLFPYTTLFRSLLGMGRNKLLDHRVKQVSEIMVPDHSVPGDGAMSWKIATSMHAPAQPTSLVADAHLQPVAGGGWKSRSEESGVGKEWVSTCRYRWTP